MIFDNVQFEFKKIFYVNFVKCGFKIQLKGEFKIRIKIYNLLITFLKAFDKIIFKIFLFFNDHRQLTLNYITAICLVNILVNE